MSPKFDISNAAAERFVAPFLPGYAITLPERLKAGVIFASPHSGANYPQDFLSRTRLSPTALRKNEDIYIDDLFRGAVDAGAPLLRATFPRCLVDANRAESELPHFWSDPLARTTPRAAAGLGVVPTHMGEQETIYRRLPDLAEVRARIVRLYRPYHAALTDLITQASEHFGQALLVDCHSMPGFAPMGARRPDIILGDRFGTSCHADTLSMIENLFRRAGYSVTINHPYAGGFVTTHYGRPERGIEAIQIEVNRDLYVNAVTLAPKTGYRALRNDLSRICAEIVKSQRPALDIAAE